MFPEFFTTGFAFSEAIYDAIADSADVEERMRKWSLCSGKKLSDFRKTNIGY